jgi:hypothetical protein
MREARTTRSRHTNPPFVVAWVCHTKPDFRDIRRAKIDHAPATGAGVGVRVQNSPVPAVRETGENRASVRGVAWRGVALIGAQFKRRGSGQGLDGLAFVCAERHHLSRHYILLGLLDGVHLY